MYFDPNLGQEVIRYETPLKKQIFVDPGTRVSRFTADDESNVSPASASDGSLNGPGSKFQKLMRKLDPIFYFFFYSFCQRRLQRWGCCLHNLDNGDDCGWLRHLFGHQYFGGLRFVHLFK